MFRRYRPPNTAVGFLIVLSERWVPGSSSARGRHVCEVELHRGQVHSRRPDQDVVLSDTRLFLSEPVWSILHLRNNPFL